MAETQMVAGEGWVSDDSSLYGDEAGQDYQQPSCEQLDEKSFWQTQHTGLNSVAIAASVPKAIPEDTVPSVPRATTSLASNIADPDRQAMERERLARRSKRKRSPSPEPLTNFKLIKSRQPLADAWQAGEAVEDFVKRLPPDTTSISTCPWIWVETPHRDLRDMSAAPQVDSFTSLGSELLAQALLHRQSMQSRSTREVKSALTKKLNQEIRELQQRIAKLAVENNILSGKWMLFPKSTDVSRIWRHVVQGVIDNRLGPTAKVATDDGGYERLICVYTKDFRDTEDVLRVLKEIEIMGLLNSQRAIYYKHDAYTYLDLKSNTAAQYGLQASLYNSRTMLSALNRTRVFPAV